MAPLNCLALFGAWLHGRHAVRSPGSSQRLGSIDSQASADRIDRMGNAVTEILSFFLSVVSIQLLQADSLCER